MKIKELRYRIIKKKMILDLAPYEITGIVWIKIGKVNDARNVMYKKSGSIKKFLDDVG